MKLEGFPDVKQIIIFFNFNARKFLNFKQIRITLNSIGAIKTLDQDEKHLQDVVRQVNKNKIDDTKNKTK